MSKSIVDDIMGTTIMCNANEDQIVLALLDTCDHSKLRPYFSQVWSKISSKQKKVGRVVVQSMKEICDKIATTKNKGQLSKEFCAMFIIIAMCVTNAKGKVTQASIR